MRTARRVATVAALVLVPLLALGNAWAEVREEFHKTVAMDADGNFELANVNGAVNITAWDRNEAQIDAVKTASSETKLHEARIEVAGSGHSIEVKTKYPEHTNNGATVEYTVHLPRGAKLSSVATVNGSVHINGIQGGTQASTVNGSVEVWSAGGAVEANSVNGEVKVTLVDAGKQRVKLNTVNGSVALGIPTSTNAHIEAATVHGNIESELPVHVEKQQFGAGANVDATLGSGGETIELNSVNGSIYLNKL